MARPIGRVSEVDADEWWRTVEINLKGVFSCTRLVLADMVARRRGRIINVTSEAGVYRWPFRRRVCRAGRGTVGASMS